MTKDEYEIAMQRLRPELIAEATRYMGNADEVEDMVQDALLKLWQMCDQLKSPVDGLARVLVRNICLDSIRRRKPREGIESLPPAAGSNEKEEHERIERMMAIVEITLRILTFVNPKFIASTAGRAVKPRVF